MDENMKRYIYIFFRFTGSAGFRKVGMGMRICISSIQASLIHTCVRDCCLLYGVCDPPPPPDPPCVNIQMYIFRRRYPVLPQVNACE